VLPPTAVCMAMTAGLLIVACTRRDVPISPQPLAPAVAAAVEESPASDGCGATGSTGLAWNVLRWDSTPELAKTTLAELGYVVESRSLKGTQHVGFRVRGTEFTALFDDRDVLCEVQMRARPAGREAISAELHEMRSRFGAPATVRSWSASRWGSMTTIAHGRRDEVQLVEEGPTAWTVRRRHDRGDDLWALDPALDLAEGPTGWGALMWGAPTAEVQRELRKMGYNFTVHPDASTACAGVGAPLIGACGQSTEVQFGHGQVMGSAIVHGARGLAMLTVETKGLKSQEEARRVWRAIESILGSPIEVENSVVTEFQDADTRAWVEARELVTHGEWLLQGGYRRRD
jgi:hypothetical protein